jgi:hypothetical protein
MTLGVRGSIPCGVACACSPEASDTAMTVAVTGGAAPFQSKSARFSTTSRTAREIQRPLCDDQCVEKESARWHSCVLFGVDRVLTYPLVQEIDSHAQAGGRSKDLTTLCGLQSAFSRFLASQLTSRRACAAEARDRIKPPSQLLCSPRSARNPWIWPSSQHHRRNAFEQRQAERRSRGYGCLQCAGLLPEPTAGWKLARASFSVPRRALVVFTHSMQSFAVFCRLAF